MAEIQITYTAVDASNYVAVFRQFNETIVPRGYLPGESFQISATGSTILSGAPVRRRYLWTLAVTMPKADAVSVMDLFEAWDADRASGKTCAVDIVDSTFGSTVTSKAIFSTPPVFDNVRSGILVSMGLTEV